MLALTYINTNLGQTTFQVEAGKPIFIVGRNGTGKSALVHRLNAILSGTVIYMPGSRPSYFDQDSLSMNASSRKAYDQNKRNWDNSLDTRIRPVSGTTRNEKAIHDLQSAENKYITEATDDIKINGVNSDAIKKLQSNQSPLDRINSIFSQANLPIQIVMNSGELRAKQAGAVYSYARMSDGERSALVFAAEVISASDGSIFLIDEPELHLHPSIVVPFLKALIVERPNCGFIVCTHVLELPENSSDSKIILVRGCQWLGESPLEWDIDILESVSEIPEQLRVDLIGSRRKILFIEGIRSSLDQPLYSLLFPTISVKSRESCREVIQAVGGLRSVDTLHRADAFGIIDNDGMNDAQKLAFEAKWIFPLSIFSVESLYYCPEVLEAIAKLQAANRGIDPIEILGHAKSSALEALANPIDQEHLAYKLVERQIRDKILLALPKRDEIIGLGNENIQITFPSPYLIELGILSGMLEAKDLDSIISRYSVRESKVLDRLVKALFFISRADYERSVLTLIRNDEQLRQAVKFKLGALAHYLD